MVTSDRTVTVDSCQVVVTGQTAAVFWSKSKPQADMLVCVCVYVCSVL